MAYAKEPYFDCIERTLRAALCVLEVASATIEGGEATPEVERPLPDAAATAHLTCTAPCTGVPQPRPLRLQWSSGDECCIEATHNSTRVSLLFAAAHDPDDALTHQLLHTYVDFISTYGATTGLLPVLRCRPAPRRASGDAAAATDRLRDYDLSFLVLAHHVCEYGPQRLIAFMLDFVRGVEAAVAEMRVSLDARRRAAARCFFGMPA